MEELTRRAFTLNMLGSLLTFSLVSTLSKAEALTPSIRAMVRPWVLEMEHATKAMRAGHISQKAWQASIQQLLAQVDLADLLRAIDFDTLRKKIVFRESHESVLDIDLPKRERLKADLSFDSFFYAMKKGVSIVPHGHQNMATMHMVLAGEAQALHYDRVASEGDYLIIKPVSDLLAKPGHASTADITNSLQVRVRFLLIDVGIGCLQLFRAKCISQPLLQIKGTSLPIEKIILVFRRIVG